MPRRTAVTLLELILVVAILAVLIALLLPAVMSVRQAAARARSMNDMRQIAIALHHYAGTHDGELPTINGNPRRTYFPDLGVWGNAVGGRVFIDIIPLLEGGTTVPAPLPSFVKPYYNALDPNHLVLMPSGTLDPSVGYHHYPSSYPCNAQVFHGQPSLARSFPDGTSGTIILAEHYVRCGDAYFSYAESSPGERGPDGLRPPGGQRRPTFADGGSILDGRNEGDVYPVTNPATGVTSPSRPGATFQVVPRLWVYDPNAPASPRPADGCDWSRPQTAFRSGLLIALADGSVRTVRQSVAPGTFWAAVTPAGGEVLGSDW